MRSKCCKTAGAQLTGEKGRSSFPYFENWKWCLDFGKHALIKIIYRLKFWFEILFKEYPGEKTINFPCRLFFLVMLTKGLFKFLYSKKPSLPWKTPGCTAELMYPSALWSTKKCGRRSFQKRPLGHGLWKRCFILTGLNSHFTRDKQIYSFQNSRVDRTNVPSLLTGKLFFGDEVVHQILW